MVSTKVLQTGSQVIATIDIVISVLSCISTFFLISLTMTYGDSVESKIQQYQIDYPELTEIFVLGRGPFILSLLCVMTIFIFYFFLGRYLLHATYEKSLKKVRRWCTITLVIIITRAVIFIAAIFFTTDRAIVPSYGIVGFLYQILSLWFIRLYQERLRTDQDDGNKIKVIQDLYDLEEQRQTHFMANQDFHK